MNSDTHQARAKAIGDYISENFPPDEETFMALVDLVIVLARDVVGPEDARHLFDVRLRQYEEDDWIHDIPQGQKPS